MRSIVVALLFLAAPLVAQDTAAIDKAVAEVMEKTGAPSVSIAVVKDGKISYARAYGDARVEMRYAIGSVSKQFTAAAVLLLAEERKLSLDDRVVRWFPELTRAKDVSVRQLLSMTSGYQDYWPQDYVPPLMREPRAPLEIAKMWAQKPLDFEPGTKWQYSNTNYVIAGMIVERVAGMPLFDFLQKRVFAPLKMTSVTDIDAAPLPPGDPTRYQRFALGPLRVAPKEGKGWLFAAGGLAMTARDLALWNISMIEQSLLQPASYRAMQTDTQLANGSGTRYGLGVGVGAAEGRRNIAHNGEVSGFTAENDVFVDDRAAVTVLANLDATNATGQIAGKIIPLLFATADAATPKATEIARKIFEGLQRGEIDRALFTANANAYFSEQAVKDFAVSLGPLGAVQEFAQTAQRLRGGMTYRGYRVKTGPKTLRISSFWMPDGTIEQFQVAAE